MFLIVSHSKPYKQIELNLFQHNLVFINKSIAKAVYVMESANFLQELPGFAPYFIIRFKDFNHP